MTTGNRSLDLVTLEAAAKHYAAEFIRPDVPHAHVEGRFIGGRQYALNQCHAFDYKDEFDAVFSMMRGFIGPDSLKDFDEAAAIKFTDRSDELFAELLHAQLACDVDGVHIPGKIGTCKGETRVIGLHMIEVESTESVLHRHRLGLDKSHRHTVQRVAPHYWPIYAGETEERLADSGVADPLPAGTPPLPVGALNTRIANVIAIKACDIIVDELDTGTADGQLVGRTGAQVADPDTAPVGTILFEHDLATPAFGAAVDNTGAARATAGAVADDTSANATGTLGWLRASSSNAFPTALDDLIDGEAGTSGADFNYNTLAIVAGATVSITSWTLDMPET